MSKRTITRTSHGVTMTSIRPLTPEEAFFFTWAGYSYNPITQTPAAGRTEGATRLADAEALFLQAVKVADVGCEWEEDPDGFHHYRADKKAGILADGIKKPERIEQATIWHRDESGTIDYLASLGGIWDADANYRRVVRAELALECADQLRDIISKHEG